MFIIPHESEKLVNGSEADFKAVITAIFDLLLSCFMQAIPFIPNLTAKQQIILHCNYTSNFHLGQQMKIWDNR